MTFSDDEVVYNVVKFTSNPCSMTSTSESYFSNDDSRTDQSPHSEEDDFYRHSQKKKSQKAEDSLNFEVDPTQLRKLSIQLQLVDIINQNMVTGEDFKRKSISMQKAQGNIQTIESNTRRVSNMSNRNVRMSQTLKRNPSILSNMTDLSVTAEQPVGVTRVSTSMQPRKSGLNVNIDPMGTPIGGRRKQSISIALAEQHRRQSIINPNQARKQSITPYADLQNVQVYDYSLLSRPSVALRRPSTIINNDGTTTISNNLPKMGICRVASDPDISSHEAATIILPTIDLRDILNSGQCAAIDSVGGKQLPKLDFGQFKQQQALTPTGSRRGSLQKKHSTLSQTHSVTDRTSKSNQMKDRRSYAQKDSDMRGSTMSARASSMSRHNKSVSERNTARMSSMSQVSNASSYRNHSIISGDTIESGEVLEEDDDHPINATKRNSCLMTVIIVCIIFTINPFPYEEKHLDSPWIWLHYLKVISGLFLLIMLIVNWQLICIALENKCSKWFKFDNKIDDNSNDPAAKARRIRSERIRSQMRPSSMSVTSNTSVRSNRSKSHGPGSQPHSGHAHGHKGTHTKRTKRRGSGNSMASMKHAINDITNK